MQKTEVNRKDAQTQRRHAKRREKTRKKSAFGFCFSFACLPLRLCVFAVYFCLTSSVPLWAQDAIEVRDLSDPQKPVTAKATISLQKSRVANPVILTLTVDGPNGLEVQLPEKILKPESAVFWRVSKYPPTQSAKGQTTVWEYKFECAAFTDGELPLAIAPLKVRRKGEAETVLEFTRSLVVTTFVKVINPSPDSLGPPTNIETPPKIIPPPQTSSLMIWLILFVPPVIGIPLALLLWKKPPPHVTQEVCDRGWLIERLHPTISADKAAKLFVRYLQSQSQEKSGNPLAMIMGLPDLSLDQKVTLLSIYQRLESIRFSNYHNITDASRIAPPELREIFLSLDTQRSS